MRAGCVVETADVISLFEAPKHPYTARLISLSTRGKLDDRSPAEERAIDVGTPT
jgi:ABC-type dipeptide/oligopeptide/nickel transport system ATPase component